MGHMDTKVTWVKIKVMRVTANLNAMVLIDGLMSTSSRNFQVISLFIIILG